MASHPPNGATGNMVTQTSIIVLIGVTAVAGIIGMTFAKENTTQIVGFCTLICVSLLNLLQQTRAVVVAEKAAVEVKEVAEKAAVEIKEVKATLQEVNIKQDEKLDSILETGQTNHKLLNSGMESQLRLHANTSRAKADITKDAGDIAVADLAERMLSDHVTNQAKADRKEAVVAPVAALRSSLKAEIAKLGNEIPEKTAVKVVEKLNE